MQGDSKHFVKVVEAMHQLISDNFDLPKSIEAAHLRIFYSHSDPMDTQGHIPHYIELNGTE